MPQSTSPIDQYGYAHRAALGYRTCGWAHSRRRNPDDMRPGRGRNVALLNDDYRRININALGWNHVDFASLRLVLKWAGSLHTLVWEM